MRKSNIINKIIGVAFAVLFMVIMLSYHNLQNTINIIKSEKDAQNELIENGILSAAKYSDIAFRFAENRINEQMRRYSEIMLAKYLQNPDVLTWNLDELKHEFNNFDVYIIDSSLVVRKSTVPEDLGLDFQQFDVFAQLLKNRLNGREFAVDRLDMSANTNEIKKFSYMPTPDHRYLLELSVNASEILPALDDLNIINVAKSLTEGYQSVDHIFIYKLGKDGGRMREIRQVYLTDDRETQEKKRLIGREAVSGNKMVIVTEKHETEGYTNTYKYIPYVVYQDNGSIDWWNSYVIEVIYNDKELQKDLLTQKKLFGSNCLLVVLAFFVLMIIIRYFTKELKESYEKVTALEKSRSRLLSNISHDLRTPISSIIGYLELIREGIVSDPKDKEKYLQRSYNKVLDLKKLIDDLFHLTKLEARQIYFNLERIPVRDLLNRVFAEYELDVRNKGLRLEIAGTSAGGDCLIRADSARIGQVFGNLITNALRYTPPGGTIILGWEKISDTEVRFKIEDNGEGISADDLPYIFERFFKGSKSRNIFAGGNGLGLVIAKEIIEYHGGNIWAESVPGQGTVFFFTLKIQ
ncbi:MAG: sensor histidine kinase [Peptococcaceae bacterium]